MKLFYKKIGEGRPIIILHGLFGSLDNWQTIGKKISENGFEVYLVDQRNHGHSPHSEQWNYEYMCDDLHELFSENNLNKASIIGHSMGGKTALTFANKYSPKVEKLIIVDIAPRYYPVHHAGIIDALKAVNVDWIQSRKEAEEVLAEKIPGDIATRQFLLKSLYWLENAEKKLAWRFNLNVISANIENVGVEVEVKNIVSPTLFMRGEKSNYVSKDDIEKILTTIPNVEVQTISNAGHWIHAEAPELFLNAALKFLTH